MADEPKPVPPPIVQPPPVIAPPVKDAVGDFLSQVGQALTTTASQAAEAMRSYDLLMQVREAMGTPGEPSVQFLKRTQCIRCGAAKALPSKTAYVYCDFCGSLADYDFQIACRTPNSALPGPAYEELLRSLHTELEYARQQQDVDRYREIQLRLFTRWVELCPMAVSPRAADPDYRSKLIAYMAEIAVTNDLDPTYQRHAAEVEQVTAAVRWQPTHARTLAISETFWPLYKAVRAQVDYSYGLLELAGVTEHHPDQVPVWLQEKLVWSMFAQGWLPYLGPEDSKAVIQETGLYGEYAPIEPKETTLRHCGQCGGDLQVIPGAKAVLCEACGRRIDVAEDEAPCPTCGALMSFPVGVGRAACPYCRAETVRV